MGVRLNNINHSLLTIVLNFLSHTTLGVLSRNPGGWVL